MSKSLRAFSLLARPIIRRYPLTRFQHSLLRQRGQVNFQAVRFRKPPLRYGRVLRFAAQFTLTSCLFYFVTEYVLGYDGDEEDRPGAETSAPSIAVVAKALPDGAEGTQVAEAEQVEELLVQLPDKMPEDAIFIPLWWGKQVPSEGYKENDPEWQGFVKFSRDTEKKNTLERNLINYVDEVTSKHPKIVKILGQSVRPISKSFDYDYPLAPPPEFERPGIEIADDYIALTSRPQSSEQHGRVRSVLWPASIAKAVFNSFTTYSGLQIAKLKGYLNIQSEAEEGKLSQIRSDALDLHKVAKASKEKGPQIDAKLERMSDPKGAQSKSANLSPTGSSSAKPSTSNISPDTSKLLSYLPNLKKSEGDFASAITSFKKTLVQSWNDQRFIDRGSFFVIGTVEIAGSKARMKIDLIATFHPGTNQLLLLSLTPKPPIAHRLVPRS